MAKIKLVDTGFSLMPEGWHTLKIDKVDYKEDFGKMEVHLVTKDGKKHTERFGLMNKGKVNEGAIKAFSYFAKVALNNFDLDEIDENDLVGCYMKARVEHVESETINEKTGQPYVNANLVEKEPAYGFKDIHADTDEKYDKAVDEEEEEIDLDDLDDFLDD